MHDDGVDVALEKSNFDSRGVWNGVVLKLKRP